MTVRDLIEKLNQLPPDAPIMLNGHEGDYYKASDCYWMLVEHRPHAPSYMGDYEEVRPEWGGHEEHPQWGSKDNQEEWEYGIHIR